MRFRLKLLIFPMALFIPLLVFAEPGEYGNWCGYNNSKDDPSHTVVDGVDEACRQHDLCLKGAGYHKCNCDAAFISALARSGARDGNGEAYRVAAIAAFSLKPCECRHDLPCIRLCNFGAAGVNADHCVLLG